MASNIFKSNNKYPSIPTVGQDIKSHTAALNAIVEAIAIHERRTKDLDNSFVRVKELVDLGLITLVGGDFNVIGVDLGSIADVGDLTSASESDFLRFRSGLWVNDQLDAGDILETFVTQHEAALDIDWSQLQNIPALVDDIGDLVDPGADRILFWDDSAGVVDFLTATGGLTIAGTSLSVADDGITDAKLRESAALSVIGRSANSIGNPADIVAGSNDTLFRRTANALDFGQLTAGMVPNDLVTDAMLRNSAATSVIGRSANSIGDPADIVAGTNDTLLRQTGSALNFGQLTVGMFPNDVVTYAKIQNVSATSRILARITSGAGDIEEATLSQVLDLVGSAANGDILYRSGGSWTRLPVSTDGFVLTLASGLPVWAAGGGGGITYNSPYTVNSNTEQFLVLNNTNSGSTADVAVKFLNNASSSAAIGYTSTGWSGAYFTGGPSGEQMFLGTLSGSANQLSIGTNGTERIRVSNTLIDLKATTVSVNGVSIRDGSIINAGLIASTFLGAGGGSGEIQFNDGGVFNGVSSFTYNSGLNAFFMGGLSTSLIELTATELNLNLSTSTTVGTGVGGGDPLPANPEFYVYIRINNSDYCFPVYAR